jgi:hypothetical protein
LIKSVWPVVLNTFVLPKIPPSLCSDKWFQQPSDLPLASYIIVHSAIHRLISPGHTSISIHPSSPPEACTLPARYQYNPFRCTNSFRIIGTRTAFSRPQPLKR